MKLKKNSLNTKFYKWFYYTCYGYNLPTNPLVYYIKLLFAYVSVVPVLLIYLPSFLVRVFYRRGLYERQYAIDRIGSGLLTYFLMSFVFCILSPIVLFFGVIPDKDGFLMGFIAGGTMCWLVLIVCGVWNLLDLIINKIPPIKIPKIKLPKIKLPKIDWED